MSQAFASSTNQMKLLTRENSLLLALSLAEGSLLVDRLAVGLMAPFLSAEFAISNSQLGLLSAVFTLSFAISGYSISALSDRANRRDEFLLALVLVFSAISATTGLVGSFAALLLLRVALGVAEGPFLPIAQAKMASVSSPHRVTFNLAFLQQIGAFVLAQGLGPVVLTHIGQHEGWRVAFLMTAVPGIAVFVWLFWQLKVRPPGQQHAMSDEKALAATGPARFSDLLRYRNVVVAGGIAACMGSWILLQMTFLPQFLVKVRGVAPSTMGVVISMTGVMGCAASLLLPALSNRYGRRPVMVCGTFAGVLLPVSLMVLPADTAVLMVAVLIGSVSFGCSPLYVSILPSDVVPPNLAARAIAFTSASSAIVGGTLMPPLGGWLADTVRPDAPLWLAACAAVIAGGLSLCLRESAPNRRGADALSMGSAQA